MRPVVGPKIASARFLKEGEGAFPKISKIRQHGFLFREKRGIERDRRFAANDAGFDHQQRKVEFHEKGHRPRRVADDAVGGSENGALDLAEVSDDFGGGPSAVVGTGLPLPGRDLVGSNEEGLLGGT